MPNVTAVQATARTASAPYNVLSPPPMTTPLRIPRRRFATLLRVLETLLVSWTKRRPMESRWMPPDKSRWETPPERAARTDPYLYIFSISG